MKPTSSSKDFLTNCFTREEFVPFLKKMEEEYLTNKKPFALLMMDIDHFKTFNDKYGHTTGDEVLKYFSSSLRLDLEDEENVPFRFGGDEFAMVFPSKTSTEAHHLAARLRKNMRTRSCLIKGRQISVTFSGGIAGYPADANNVEDVLERADKALYYSKNHGRGRITQYGDLPQKELIQILAILGVLAFLGGSIFLFRDGLSAAVGPALSEAGRWIAPPAAPKKSVPAEEPVLPRAADTVTEASLTPAPPAAPEPAPYDEILLDSGRVVRGVIKHEDDEVVEVEVGLQEGKGILQLKKAQITSVRRDLKATS